MSTPPSFTLPFDKLPASLLLFPMPHAVVMPGCQLPLNIFEPRYLNMVFDALAEQRLIGMVQPEITASDEKTLALYKTGTAGRITFFNETNDNRLMVVLTGVCRFDIKEEVPTTRGYRRVLVDWSRFRGDTEEDSVSDMERGHFLQQLRSYCEYKRLDIEWPVLEHVSMVDLVNRLTCVLPLEVAERQLLIEAVTLPERLEILSMLLRCETLETTSDASRRH
ncbi:MAG: LON peptidase substrate-binding domain-containing protein [Proteobacteria bacterium]|nr:LON peptidase substrate-binding domain-containing protein [Pseudomonadota bacterium]